MKLLALDIGSRYIGVAITGDNGILVNSHYIIEVRSKKEGIDKINKLIKDLKIDKVILGYPYLSNKERKTFIQLLIDEYYNSISIEKEMVDEANTSLEEYEIYGKRKRIDDLVAKKILEEYINKK